MIDPDENNKWGTQIELNKVVHARLQDAFYRDGLLFALSVVAMLIAILALMRS